jgi:hypothetical protein
MGAENVDLIGEQLAGQTLIEAIAWPGQGKYCQACEVHHLRKCPRDR